MNFTFQACNLKMIFAILNSIEKYMLNLDLKKSNISNKN